MDIENNVRPLRCRFAIRPANVNEARRIDDALQLLIHRLVRRELDRQRREYEQPMLLHQGENEYGQKRTR